MSLEHPVPVQRDDAVVINVPGRLGILVAPLVAPRPLVHVRRIKRYDIEAALPVGQPTKVVGRVGDRLQVRAMEVVPREIELSPEDASTERHVRHAAAARNIESSDLCEQLPVIAAYMARVDELLDAR